MTRHGVVPCTERSDKFLIGAGTVGSSLAAHSDGMDAAVVASSISQIKELLPDYGDGFLLACLRVRGPAL